MPRRSTLLRHLLTVGLTGAVVLGSASTATAAEPAPDPPATASASPAVADLAAPGDAGQDYWASDDCHYFARGGKWLSDICARGLVDTTGAVIPGVLSHFPNLGGGQLGRELTRYDFNMPGWIAFSTVTAQNTLGPWFRISITNPALRQSLGQTQDGQSIWVDLPGTSTTTVGGSASASDLGWVDTPAKAQYWQLQANLEQAHQDRVTVAAGGSWLPPS